MSINLFANKGEIYKKINTYPVGCWKNRYRGRKVMEKPSRVIMAGNDVIALGTAILSDYIFLYLSVSLNIKKACKLLNVSHSGYYKYLERKPSAHDMKNGVLSTEIQKIFDEHKAQYGSLRISKVLEQNGIKVNRKRVARLMRTIGVYPKGTRHKYKRYYQNNAKNERPIRNSSF